MGAVDATALARDYGPTLVAVAIFLWGATWGVIRWAAHKEFASKKDIDEVNKALAEAQAQVYEKMTELARVLRDEDGEQEKEIIKLRGEVRLLEQRIESLPGFKQLDDMRNDIHEVKIGQVAGREKIDGMKDDVDRISRSLERVEEILRAQQERNHQRRN